MQMPHQSTNGDWDNEPDQSETIVTNAFRIESRWPQWAKWRIVGPAPHSERHLFDPKGLVFRTLAEAQRVCMELSISNPGEFRVILPCGCPENRPIMTHGAEVRLGKLIAALQRCAAVLRRQVNGIAVSGSEVNAALNEANNVVAEVQAAKEQA